MPRMGSRVTPMGSRIITLSVLGIVSVFQFGCASSSRHCEDDVCTIKEGNQVRYEGDAQKIAAIKNKEAVKRKKITEIQSAYDAAPRRTASEPVSVGFLIFNVSGDAEMESLLPKYYKMIWDEGIASGITWTDQEKVAFALDSMTANEHGVPGQGAKKKVEIGPGMGLDFQVRGAPVDVIFTVNLALKEKTGFAADKTGVGMAQVVNVLFDTKTTSAYNFKQVPLSEIGGSIGSLAMAGMDAKGKSGHLRLNGKRQPEGDRQAIKALMAKVKVLIDSKIRPTLPALASVQEINKKLLPGGGDPKRAAASAVADALKNMFGKKPEDKK